jgi:hypothetical protein
MPRGHFHDHQGTAHSVPADPRTRYLIVRQDDVWFIKFDGEEYGPYNGEREAILFAIDAAHALGEQGEATQVLRLDAKGEVQPEWTSGVDPYPPKH